jgi:hypothetical protein
MAALVCNSTLSGLLQPRLTSSRRVDTHVDPPIKRRKPDDVNAVYDRYNHRMSFYEDVPAILLQLKEDPEIHVAVASRTSAPRACVLDHMIPLTLPQLIASSQCGSSAGSAFNPKQ